ncbi:DUF1256 domain-containing protein [Haloimpatiens massiliensis]|uniref:DUF1256 domain-containing protein n=1 Tax=Haloimpatiens massiliensis TaxID=1658110 RepID=UPI000C83BDAC|nr:DUF1256 domain-containing protein [Haloimpatiens massiliensis]
MILSFLYNKFHMKLRESSQNKYIPKDTYMKIVDFLKDYTEKDIIIVCIGTNRTNLVDCLGPFVGSILKEDKEFNIPVYGSMVNPIHGLNLTEKITKIKNNYPNSTIIAVDAAIGECEDIGEITISNLTSAK